MFRIVGAERLQEDDDDDDDDSNGGARNQEMDSRFSFAISHGRRRCCAVDCRWSSCCANAWLLETSSHGHRKPRPGRNSDKEHGILNTGLIGILSASTPIFNEEASGKWIVVGKKKKSTHKLRNR